MFCTSVFVAAPTSRLLLQEVASQQMLQLMKQVAKAAAFRRSIVRGCEMAFVSPAK